MPFQGIKVPLTLFFSPLFMAYSSSSSVRGGEEDLEALCSGPDKVQVTRFAAFPFLFLPLWYLMEQLLLHLLLLFILLLLLLLVITYYLQGHKFSIACIF